MKTNFHTHTYRCGHARGDERAYAAAAFEAGFGLLGFSDHSPWPDDGGVPGVRMDASELPGYVSSLRALREAYRGRMDIRIGLECEYFPPYMGWLREKIDEFALDYVILGSHFRVDERSGRFIGWPNDIGGARDYVRHAVAGMETGLYAYLAHPELFLKWQPEWNDDIADACRELCRAARALDVPVEYNLEGVRSLRLGHQPGVGYPNRRFWEIAAEEGCAAVIGCDAHMPESLSDDADFEAARHLLEDELGMHECVEKLRLFNAQEGPTA